MRNSPIGYILVALGLGLIANALSPLLNALITWVAHQGWVTNFLSQLAANLLTLGLALLVLHNRRHEGDSPRKRTK